MTDTEIIKALECHSNDIEVCKSCPLTNEECCSVKLAKNVLDLIERQKAEIERLTTLAELGNMRSNDYRAMRDKLKAANAEIERLNGCVKSEDEVRAIMKSQMESVVKEIAEEQIDIAVKLAKAKAVKEFAELLYKRCSERYTFCFMLGHEIGQIFKEMGVE